ncbi:MAG: aspartyl-tRNA(Asn)/glutamyl-tRNA(Gln) amidotransferase subunit A [Pseudohongiellaceae bacterium]|jgi:aspartyl-tRNA(Asn)/glutamyl-tRNA(Gln) amidotransferase subunit A
MNKEFDYMSAIELKKLIASKEVSPVEIVERSLARMEEMETKLNAFVTNTPELALDAARRAEQEVIMGKPLGLLHGLPLSVKDLIPVKDVRFTFGSKTAAENIAPMDAPAVERARAEGACIIGKTTTSEFGAKAVGDSPLTGITRNPWCLEKTPGGSSAGAAASVAAGVSPLALGTDGGGSIRIPASMNGLFGIKAQFGRVPIFPTSATPTLAHIGPLTRTVRDSALLLQAIAGYDQRDPFTVAGETPDFLAACDKPIKGMRIAWSPTMGFAKPLPEVLEIAERAALAFQDMGCTVELVDFVMDDPGDMWMAEFYAGVGTKLQGVLRSDPDKIDTAVAEVLRGALDQSIEDYYGLVFRRYEFREKMRKFFTKYDLLLTPTIPVAAPDVGIDVPPEVAGRNIVSWVYYTYPFNLTGQPAASVPAGFTTAGLPVGLQMVGGMHSECDIFRAAAALEEKCPWAQHRPKGI